MKVVLASRSPQRRALLEALGVEFEVAEPKIDELTEGEPRELVLENARWKASAVAANAAAGHARDRGRHRGRPRRPGAGPARRTRTRRAAHLERLSGREHEVLGALALLGPERGGRDGRARARGWSRRGSASATLEPACSTPTSPRASGRGGRAPTRSRASARRWSRRSTGDVSNVIGLPIPLLLGAGALRFQRALRRSATFDRSCIESKYAAGGRCCCCSSSPR